VKRSELGNGRGELIIGLDWGRGKWAADAPLLRRKGRGGRKKKNIKGQSKKEQMQVVVGRLLL